MEDLATFYSLSLALQRFRKEYEAHVPASMNPNEPHPMRRAAAFTDLLANWAIPHGWFFDPETALSLHFYQTSYRGSDLLRCVLQWLGHFRWPPDDPAVAPEHTKIGVSWMELVLSFMYFSNESDKGSGISAPNNHHNLRSGRCSERYPIVWRTLARVGTRRGTPEGLVPVANEVSCERRERDTATYRNARKARERNGTARPNEATCTSAETTAGAIVS